MVRQQEKSEHTRAVLLGAFRTMLLEKGAGGTTIDAVLAATGLSKGALYHHFRSKTEILEAIYEAESHGAIRRAVASMPGRVGPMARLKRACEAWLEEVAEPEVARIVLEIGPQALGLERVLEIENRLSLQLFEASLREANAAGETRLARPDLAARMINAMVAELARLHQPDRRQAAAALGPVIDAIVAGLDDDRLPSLPVP